MRIYAHVIIVIMILIGLIRSEYTQKERGRGRFGRCGIASLPMQPVAVSANNDRFLHRPLLQQMACSLLPDRLLGTEAELRKVAQTFAPGQWLADESIMMVYCLLHCDFRVEL